VVAVDDDDVEGDPAASDPALDASAAATPPPTPVPTPEPTPLPPKKPFAVSLYHEGDWVGQYTLTWCVGASIQMMVNVALPGQDRTRKAQAEFQRLAQGSEELDADRGAGSWGWARTLTDLGVGQYYVGYEFTFTDAIRTAARAMAQTKRPVGLLVWGGKHAWVMTGFTADADPRIHPDFKVTGVRVLDPLYPRQNADLGPAPSPNALLKPSTLDNYFVGWRWWTRQRARSSPSPSASGSGAFSTSSSGSWRLVLPASA
jgi:hypothetical protein